MVGELLGSDASVAPLPALIEGKAGGNPFFTEEVVWSLVESGALELSFEYIDREQLVDH